MLKKQLYKVYILALLIPLLVIGTYLLYNNYTMLYEHHEEMLRSDNIRVRSIIFELTTSITNISDSISESDDVEELLRSRYSSHELAFEAIEEISVLKDFFNRQTEISSIVLLTNHPDLFSYDQIKVVEEDNEWYKEQMKTPGYHWSVVTKTNNLDVEYMELQLAHPINVIKSEYDGLLLITVSSNYLKNRIDNNTLDADLIVDNYPIFYSTWGNIGENIEFKEYSNKEFFDYSGIESYTEGSGLTEVSTIKPIKSEDSIYVFSTDLQAVSRIKTIQYWTILIVAISIAIPTLVILNYTKQLTNRVDTLRLEMHRVTGGDYNIIESFKGNDELVDLFQDLKMMIKSIKKRDQEIFNARLKEQELISHQKMMEMEILSSKINPHFLYNTLETIRMRAFSTDDLEVARAVKLLGQYMRYNLESTGEATTLANELRFIGLYLDIQALRFHTRIVSKVIIEEGIDTNEIHILPLLIQPIVENAFIHAHRETTEGGLINIELERYEEDIRIAIHDNGTGMDEVTKDRVTKKINRLEAENGSIGLQNINKRLKLYYGQAYGLHLSTINGRGSTISFRVPINQKSDQG